MAKNDRRTRYTKQVIKNSFIELLRTTPIEQITVKALCEKAEINRATFYNHYETLTVLMEELEYETYKSFSSLLNTGLRNESFVAQLVSTILQHLKDNPNSRDLFLSRTTAGKGLYRLMDELQRDNIIPVLHLSEEKQRKAQWTLTFVSSGMREVLRQWFAGDLQNEEELIDTLSYFIHSALHGILWE